MGERALRLQVVLSAWVWGPQCLQGPPILGPSLLPSVLLSFSLEHG